MRRPAFRALDGVELVLPMEGDRWVLVPRGLAWSEPDLTWALEYEDASITPQLRDELGGDPWLDYSDGALLVPIERWNARATIEPALVGRRVRSSAPAERWYEPPVSQPEREHRPVRRDVVRVVRSSAGVAMRGGRVAHRASRWVVDAAALTLAASFAFAAAGWFLVLRDGMGGAEGGTGALLLAVAMPLAALSRRACFGVLGHLARGIFSGGARIIAIVFAAFLLGIGP